MKLEKKKKINGNEIKIFSISIDILLNFQFLLTTARQLLQQRMQDASRF